MFKIFQFQDIKINVFGREDKLFFTGIRYQNQLVILIRVIQFELMYGQRTK